MFDYISNFSSDSRSPCYNALTIFVCYCIHQCWIKIPWKLKLTSSNQRYMILIFFLKVETLKICFPLSFGAEGQKLDQKKQTIIFFTVTFLDEPNLLLFFFRIEKIAKMGPLRRRYWEKSVKGQFAAAAGQILSIFLQMKI